jgi:hypothetical protein
VILRVAESNPWIHGDLDEEEELMFGQASIDADQFSRLN